MAIMRQASFLLLISASSVYAQSSAVIVSPTDGATISGTVDVAVEAALPGSIAEVQLFKDDVFFQSASLAGPDNRFHFSWNTSAETNGSHSLRAVAYDLSENMATSPTVVVNVNNVQPPPPTNEAPTVNAGPDQAITLPAAASVSGAASDDGLPNPPAALTYQWSLVSGPGSATFADSSALATNVSFSAAGAYVLRLTVSDSLLSASDDLRVQVNSIAPPPPVNQAPIVNAGLDQTIMLPTAASLSGAASDDGLPDPPAALTYQWSLVSGPGTAAFADPAVLSTVVNFSAAGAYVLRLTASDSVLSASDELSIQVDAPPPPPPLSCDFLSKAVAATESVTLSGQATVKGSVQAGGAFTGHGNALVTGDVTASPITLVGNAGIGGRMTEVAGTPLPRPPFDLAAAFASARISNNNASIPADLIVDGALVLNSRTQLTLADGVYFFTGMRLNGQSRLSASGNVTIFLHGPLSITGGSVVNDQNAGNLWIFADSADPLQSAGHSHSFYSLYAPAAAVTLSGGTELTGCVAAKLVVASGNGIVINYPNAGSESVVRVRKGKRRVSLVSTDSSGNRSTSSSAEARALAVSLRRGSQQSLRFEEDVEEASIIGLNGRPILTKRKEGSAIEILLQSSIDAGLRMESGLYLVQAKTKDGSSSYPLIIVK